MDQPLDDAHFDRIKLAYWGCRFFDNEADCPKSVWLRKSCPNNVSYVLMPENDLRCASCGEKLDRKDACKVRLGRDKVVFYCQGCSGDLIRAIRPPK